MNLPLIINEQFVEIRVFFQRKGTKIEQNGKIYFLLHMEKVRISDDSLTMALFDYCGSLSQ